MLPEGQAKILKLRSNLYKMRWKILFFLLSLKNRKDFIQIKVIVSLKTNHQLCHLKPSKLIRRNILKQKFNRSLCLSKYKSNHITRILTIIFRVDKKVKLLKLKVFVKEAIVWLLKEILNIK